MATNDDVLSFMKDLERKFDSLEENVEGFKASRARAKTSTSRGTAPFMTSTSLTAVRAP